MLFCAFCGIITHTKRGGIVMDNLHEIDKEIEDIINSGKYPIVTNKIFDSIENIEIDKGIQDHLEYTVDLYKNYLDELSKLPLEKRVNFLKALKAAEIIDNQKLEQENSFLIGLYRNVQENNSIDEMLKINNRQLTSEDLLKVHKLLLDGTTVGKKDNNGYRVNNRKFVGTWNNGVRNIQYFPIEYQNIDDSVSKFLSYYNQKENNELSALLKPFIIHGLLASLQLFNDGNTRLARLLQHTKIWEATVENLNIDIPMPAIYMSRSCYPHRAQYRDKIKNIAINMDDVSWNDWFNFNLNRFEDQLFYIDYNLDEYKKIM